MTAAQLAAIIAGNFDGEFHDDSGTFVSATNHEESVDFRIEGQRFLFHVVEVTPRP